MNSSFNEGRDMKKSLLWKLCVLWATLLMVAGVVLFWHYGHTKGQSDFILVGAGAFITGFGWICVLVLPDRAFKAVEGIATTARPSIVTYVGNDGQVSQVYVSNGVAVNLTPKI